MTLDSKCQYELLLPVSLSQLLTALCVIRKKKKKAKD